MNQNTKIQIEIESRGHYTEKELEKLSQIICDFLLGPDGEGLVVGKMFNLDEKTFDIKKISIKIPEKEVWGLLG